MALEHLDWHSLRRATDKLKELADKAKLGRVHRMEIDMVLAAICEKPRFTVGSPLAGFAANWRNRLDGIVVEMESFVRDLKGVVADLRAVEAAKAKAVGAPAR